MEEMLVQKRLLPEMKKLSGPVIRLNIAAEKVYNKKNKNTSFTLTHNKTYNLCVTN